LSTQTIIARYLRSSSSTIRIKLINVALQKGSTDCDLYAIAMTMLTSIALKEDSADVIYDQKGLRVHLKESFDVGYINKFPTSKKSRLHISELQWKRRIQYTAVADFQTLKTGQKW